MTTGPTKSERSLLIESSADLLLYGMGERSIVEVADAIDGGIGSLGYHMDCRFCFQGKRPKILVKKLLCCRHLMRFHQINANMPKAFISSIRIQTHFPASE